LSLSFYSVNSQTKEEYLQLFYCDHTPPTAHYEYEEKLHLLADNEENLATILADRAVNPDIGYVTNLYKKFCMSQLGVQNGINMFECLESEVENYNKLGYGKAIFQPFDKNKKQSFVLYMLSSFDSLNTSMTFLYTSCAIGALPLGVILTSDESENTLKFEFDFLKIVLPIKAFYNRGPEMIPMQNEMHLGIVENNQLPIMDHIKSMVYASTEAELVSSFENWALFFHIVLPTCRNNTNNYVETSFGLLKDIVFRRTQAYNIVQIFYFITNKLERFYEHCLLYISNQHSVKMHITKRFLSYRHRELNLEGIQHKKDGIIFDVPSATKARIMYIVDPTIGICSCYVGISGALCKHQAAIAIKF
ncbi:20054_t:CDS:2, partial [Gigaspora margarita]